jgi:hypothetical protein
MKADGHGLPAGGNLPTEYRAEVGGGGTYAAARFLDRAEVVTPVQADPARRAPSSRRRDGTPARRQKGQGAYPRTAERETDDGGFRKRNQPQEQEENQP